jgi:hypothetical protein
MRWNPKAGHVPRGFCGAISTPDDVKLVLITAEPGDPHAEENHEDNRTVNGRFNSATNYVWNCYAVNGVEIFFTATYVISLIFAGQSWKATSRKKCAVYY